MKLNLNIPLAEIYLLSVLWLPSLAAAPTAPEQLARIDSARARVKNTISELEERVALTRSAGEFVEELGLFDNRVYGRVAERKTLQDEKVNTLNVQIENKSNMLEALRNTPPTEGTFKGNDAEVEIVDTDRGTFNNPPSGQENELKVSQLEGEIADLNRELNQLTLPLEGGTELLDCSPLSDETLPPVETLGEDAARTALEQQRRLLLELDLEARRLVEQGDASPGGSGGENKQN